MAHFGCLVSLLLNTSWKRRAGATGRALPQTCAAGDALCAALSATQENIQQRLFSFLDDKYFSEERPSTELSGRTMAAKFGLVKAEVEVLKEVSLLSLLIPQFESLHVRGEGGGGSGGAVEEALTRILVRICVSCLFPQSPQCVDGNSLSLSRMRLLNQSRVLVFLTAPEPRE